MRGMAMDKPLSEISSAELLLGTALIWKLLSDELCAPDQKARERLIANLDRMVSLLRSDAYQGTSGVVAAMSLFRVVLTADVSLESLMSGLGKFQGGSTH